MASPNLNSILSILLKQVQIVENVFHSVIVSRFIGSAVGVQLDQIGRLVGEPRYGRADDAVYRRAIRLRIFVNGSSGRPEDIIQIARFWTGFSVVDYFDLPQAGSQGGNYRIVIPGWTPDDGSLHAFLQSVSPAGVRLVSVDSTYDYVPFEMGDVMGTRLYHT